MEQHVGMPGFGDVAAAQPVLCARPLRTRIDAAGGSEYIDVAVRVPAIKRVVADRRAIRIVFVIDRSGSMAGGKLDMAKRAVIAALQRLTPEDQAAVVMFDDHIDIVQSLAPVTPSMRAYVETALRSVQPRASTALHEGWLTGCGAITDSSLPNTAGALARCFLLTDGLANVGITDVEAIATDAAGVLKNTSISTSTFGLGMDYNESLLGPMAAAGGGQFHHLRTTADISATFLGELGDLGSVAVDAVTLELHFPVTLKVSGVSEYRFEQHVSGTLSVQLGALLGGEERHAVVQVHAPAGVVGTAVLLQARLRYAVKGEEATTTWQDVQFTYDTASACQAEQPAPDIAHWVNLHVGYQALRKSTEESRDGKLAEAGKSVAYALAHMRANAAGADTETAALLEEMAMHQAEAAAMPMAPATSKERYFQAQRRSTNRPDYRS